MWRLYCNCRLLISTSFDASETLCDLYHFLDIFTYVFAFAWYDKIYFGHAL